MIVCNKSAMELSMDFSLNLIWTMIEDHSLLHDGKYIVDKLSSNSDYIPTAFFHIRVSNGPRKKSVPQNFSVKFHRSRSLVFSQIAISESRILKTQEISGKSSQALKIMPCLGVSQSLTLTI